MMFSTMLLSQMDSKIIRLRIVFVAKNINYLVSINSIKSILILLRNKSMLLIPLRFNCPNIAIYGFNSLYFISYKYTDLH